MMDQKGMSYRRHDNCFPWIEDVDKAQKLMNRQLRISWLKTMTRVAHRLNPLHGQMFRGFPLPSYYWSMFQSEWAADVMFEKASDLAAIYPAMVVHAMQTFSSGDVRFLGRKVHTTFQGDIVSDFKNRPEGIRIKHRANANSIKAYDKAGSILRVETTMNEPDDFKVFRPKEGDPRGKSEWRPLRRGVADVYRRAQVSQAANERYFDALASVDTSTSLGQLIRISARPTTYRGKRVRALRPWAESDLAIFRAVSRAEFCVNVLAAHRITLQQLNTLAA